MSREFFSAVKEKPPRTNITKLTNTHGASLTSRKDIEEACLTFYRELYTAKESDEQSSQSERDFLEALPESISPLMALNLNKPLSESELHGAACALARDKAPGPDGVAMDFFTTFWQQIGEDFHHMVSNSLHSGRFPQGVTRGLITLISKGGDLKELGHWRPITLLNACYKIYAKALQLRLQDPLSEIISLDQCTYLKNRHILDNILLTHETLSWAKKSKQDTIFLKLDFSKAFDRVD